MENLDAASLISLKLRPQDKHLFGPMWDAVTEDLAAYERKTLIMRLLNVMDNPILAQYIGSARGNQGQGQLPDQAAGAASVLGTEGEEE